MRSHQQPLQQTMLLCGRQATLTSNNTSDRPPSANSTADASNNPPHPCKILARGRSAHALLTPAVPHSPQPFLPQKRPITAQISARNKGIAPLGTPAAHSGLAMFIARIKPCHSQSTEDAGPDISQHETSSLPTATTPGSLTGTELCSRGRLEDDMSSLPPTFLLRPFPLCCNMQLQNAESEKRETAQLQLQLRSASPHFSASFTRTIKVPPINHQHLAIEPSSPPGDT